MDFVKWCLEHGLGGWVLLALIAFAALLLVMAVLSVLLKLLGFAGRLGGAFRKGWREAGEARDET